MLGVEEVAVVAVAVVQQHVKDARVAQQLFLGDAPALLWGGTAAAGQAGDSDVGEGRVGSAGRTGAVVSTLTYAG